ncbi:MAG: signal recognition particle receptor subunit alpha [Candidatus Shikimatogenerans bostrichidophilus]|nr:MAG: signal recognition particle receptor subunit alpha [Candidatus Shikimatogenerans bostrichidophilus]
MINNFFFFINKIFYNNFKNNKIIKKLELNLINNDFGIKITYNIIKNIEKFKNKKSKILLYIKKYFFNLFLIKKKTINFNKQISLF